MIAIVDLRKRTSLLSDLDSGYTGQMFTLAITGFDVDPRIVTDVLQLQPSATAIKGEISKAGNAHRFNGWWLDVHPERMTDGVSHARSMSLIVDHLRGREAAFQRLIQEFKPDQITLYGAMYFAVEAQCGLWLDPPEMALLAACGVGWGLDLVAQDTRDERDEDDARSL